MSDWQNLIVSWVLISCGIAIALPLDGNWQIVTIGVFGSLGNVFRMQAVKERTGSIFDYIEMFPYLKWFTVIYFLIASVLSLYFMNELSDLLQESNIFMVLLVLFFPMFVIWIHEDINLPTYNNSTADDF